MAMNRSNFSRQYVPGINAIVGFEYGLVEQEHLLLFEMEKTEKAFDEEILMSGFGTAPAKTEGSAIIYDTAQQSYVARYTPATVALGFAITEEAMEDNLYDTIPKLRAKELGRAMGNTEQTRAANIFNNGFSADFLGGDRAALFSASHPTVGDGNQSNTASTDISETQLETEIINVTLIENDRGILINAMPELLLVPPQNAFNAERLLRSPGQANTANNAINAVASMGYFPKGWVVNRRLTDVDAWFIKTNVPNSTKCFVRTPLQFKVEGDFDTGNMRYKVRQRYIHGWTDWRGWRGSQGA